MDFVALHVGRHRGLVVAVHGDAVPGDGDAADGDGEPVPVGRLAGLADRHDDPAPVGVLAGDGGLDQGRVGDGAAHHLGRPVVLGAGHGDFDELGRPLPVPDDLMGEVEAHLVEGIPEFPEMRVAGLGDPLVLRPAGGEQQDRVAGRGVGIDGDVVEAPVDRVLQEMLQHAVGDGRIGEDERQHGRHVGRDHPRTLGDPGDGHGRAADLHPAGAALGEGVRGGDGPGRRLPVAAEIPGHPAQGGRHFSHVDGLADDAGLGDEHLTGITADGLGRRPGHRRDRVRSRLAGKRVGVARIDHQAPGLSRGKRGAAPIDGRRGSLRPGEDAGHVGARR